MTTLPQTSSIRLPRAGGQGAGMVSMAGVPAVVAQQPASSVGLTPADVWRVLRRNLWLIALLLIIGTGTGLGLWYFLKTTAPRFTVEGTVSLKKTQVFDPFDKGRGRWEDPTPLDVDLRTQSAVMNDSLLWNYVIENSSLLRQTPWFQSFESKAKMASASGGDTMSGASMAREELKKFFKAKPIIGTRNIQVVFESGYKEDAVTIVNEIVAQYMLNQQENARGRTNIELENVKQLRSRYNSQMISKKELLASIESRLSSNGVLGAVNRMSLKEIELSNLLSRQLKLQQDANGAQARLQSLNQMIAKGSDPVGVEQAVSNDPTIVRMRGDLDSYEMQMDIAMHAGGEKSRNYTDLVSRRDFTKSRLETREQEVRTLARAQLIDMATSDATSSTSELASVTSSVDSIRGELGTLSSDFAQYNSLKDEIEGYRQLYSELGDRQSILETTYKSQDSGITWYPPSVPQKPSFPDFSTFLTGGIAIGLFLSLGIAFARELLDTSVRSPRDIQRVGPMNMLGMIPADMDDPESTGISLHLAISQSPNSIIAEQFRQVRTRLQHAASLDTTRSIVVTSPAPGDGKSTVACNLAAGLALNGRRILLVDANFRRAELHRLFGVQNEMGFTNVLESIGNLEAAVQKTSVPNLELLTTGPRPSNPTELIESQLFSDFIDRVLEEYDHVIFDAGPLLVVSEAVALAPRVDGVITVVRAKVNTRGMLLRVRDTLKQIKAENLGVVLNGVETWGGGYYGRNIRTYYAYQNGN